MADRLGNLRTASASLAVTGIHGTAMAHTSERGHIMLLPTEFYVLGGASAVAASVLLVALLPFLNRSWPRSQSVAVAVLTPLTRNVPSLASVLLICVLIAAGLAGPPDPIANPLPGAVWTLWWSGFTILALLLGNLWPALNPWSGLHAILRPTSAAPLAYPTWLGQWPAVVLFFGFAWFELVYPTPFDPQRLAVAVAAYLVLTFTGVLLMGQDWLQNAECFGVYFRMLGRLSPLQWQEHGGRLKLTAVLPGAGLLTGEPLTAGHGAFVMLALSAVSFDGFMRTFFWAGRLGINPLEYPGRTALLWPNSLGLAAMFLALAFAYGCAVRLDRALAGAPPPRALVNAIIPVAIAYHVAHYLPEFPAAFLQTLKALGDPFGSGLDLFGWTAIDPPASFMMDHDIAQMVYRVQTGIIVAGHVIAVAIAHAMVTDPRVPPRRAMIAQLPLNALMVLYTMFGLWLLSTPVIG